MNNTIKKAFMFMPEDEESKKILRQRAADYAVACNQQDDVDIGLPYVKFKLGHSESYGIEFSHARGVVQASHLKKPPCVSSIVCGLINYQGKLIGVIDLENALNLKSGSKSYNELSNIIIVDNHQMTVGMVVGEIQMSDNYKPDTSADSVLSESEKHHGYIKGIDKGTVSIINVDKLLASIKLTDGEAI